MLLEMQNVVKRFGGLTAVSNISFHVEEVSSGRTAPVKQRFST